MADLFDVVVARKLSGGGGGGGSSDFSTASITLVSSNAEAAVSFYSVYYDETLEQNLLNGMVKVGDHWTSEASWSGNINETIEALMFEDSIIFTSAQGTVTATGDATVGEEGEYGTDITITGDCTITIS